MRNFWKKATEEYSPGAHAAQALGVH